MLIAYCFRSGHIAFGEDVPVGALPICAGPPAEVTEIVEVQARHVEIPTLLEGLTTSELLVPGIPEADNDDDELEALYAFQRRVMRTATSRSVELVHGQAIGVPMEVEEV